MEEKGQQREDRERDGRGDGRGGEGEGDISINKKQQATRGALVQRTR